MVQTATWTTYLVPNHLMSDTEESVVGALWHQRSISTLADMLEDVSARRGAVWGVADQIALIGRHIIWNICRPWGGLLPGVRVGIVGKDGDG